MRDRAAGCLRECTLVETSEQVPLPAGDGGEGKLRFWQLAAKVVWSRPSRLSNVTSDDATASLGRAQASQESPMATIAVGRLSTVANEVESQSVETPADSAARAEVDVLARALYAVSMHSSLTDALLSFYHA